MNLLKVHPFYALFVKPRQFSPSHPSLTCALVISTEKRRERERKNGPWAKDETKRANYFESSFQFTFSLFIAVLILLIINFALSKAGLLEI